MTALRGERLLRTARESAAYMDQRIAEEADKRLEQTVRSYFREAERRIKAFDRATNRRGSHEAFQACLIVLREVCDTVGSESHE